LDCWIGKNQRMLREMLPDEVPYDIYAEYGYFVDTENNTFYHGFDGVSNRASIVDREEPSLREPVVNGDEKQKNVRAKGLLVCLHTLSCICVSLVAYQMWCI